eukprot:TRINITY_DN1857_c0_g1_i1.p1 TRINITY_DN1857_c0_g1~~TRINITY_DN1857_c0_g1_i1.p1  ORF type:complete len:325 (-),score=55.63 TRINITY_DN1857_c0_g1_i1:71-1045(-)
MDKNDMIKGKTKKKNVKKACQYCKKSHKKCDNFRPCTNCIKYKKECFNESSKRKAFNTGSSLTQSIMPIIINNTVDRIYTLEDLKGIMGPEDYIEKYGSEIIQNLRPNESHRIILRENNELMMTPSEEEDLRKEIEYLTKQIKIMDEGEIPEDFMKMDPIEFINIKKLCMKPNITLPFLPSDGRKAGGMFLIGTFDKIPTSNPINFYAKYWRVLDVSDSFSLCSGRVPPDMIGKTYDNFCLSYSNETHSQLGNQISSLLKDKINFIRVIDVIKNDKGELIAYDSHCAIFCDDNGVPNFTFLYIKEIKKLEGKTTNMIPRFTPLL